MKDLAMKTAAFLAAAAAAHFFCRAIGPQVSSFILQITIAAFLADRWLTPTPKPKPTTPAPAARSPHPLPVALIANPNDETRRRLLKAGLGLN